LFKDVLLDLVTILSLQVKTPYNEEWKGKGKGFLPQAWKSPWCSRRLRLQNF
jgi:hypothetical protein